MSVALQIILAVIGSGGFTALITGLISANQRRKDRNDSISKSLNSITEKLDAHIEENEIQFVKQDRARIIAFADECSRKIPHSKEAFDDILASIDHYEDYCADHPKFANSKAVLSIQVIKDIYKKCQAENKFI
ncbi:MAG: hypothetical protein IKF49_04400 [Clostridia bacterium]|nr:hypothetical protein [Clostridia bacterium]